MLLVYVVLYCSQNTASGAAALSPTKQTSSVIKHLMELHEKSGQKHHLLCRELHFDNLRPLHAVQPLSGGRTVKYNPTVHSRHSRELDVRTVPLFGVT